MIKRFQNRCKHTTDFPRTLCRFCLERAKYMVVWIHLTNEEASKKCRHECLKSIVFLFSGNKWSLVQLYLFWNRKLVMKFLQTSEPELHQNKNPRISAKQNDVLLKLKEVKNLNTHRRRDDTEKSMQWCWIKTGVCCPKRQVFFLKKKNQLPTTAFKICECSSAVADLFCFTFQKHYSAVQEKSLLFFSSALNCTISELTHHGSSRWRTLTSLYSTAIELPK